MSCELALNYKFWDVRIEDDKIWQREFSHPEPTASTIKFLFRNPLNNANKVTIDGDRYHVLLEPMKHPLEEEASALGSGYCNSSASTIPNGIGSSTRPRLLPTIWAVVCAWATRDQAS